MLTFEPLPMKEAQAFWRHKVSLPPGRFARLSDEARLRAFAVAGIAKAADLATVFNTLQQALDAGISYGQFKQQAGAVFKKRGWTGRRAWRVDNIFRTNIQTAYNVGRYRQMQRVVKRRPYWMYDAVNDRRTRPIHAALSGKVFPADHPFWDVWYPINGFRCRCSVRSLSAAQVKALGLKVESEDPTGKLFEPVDPRTGGKMPARLLLPDPGFAHHPGKTVWGGVVDAATGPAKWVDEANLKGPAAYRRRKLANVRPADIADLDASSLLPTGLSDEAYREAFIARHGQEKVVSDASGGAVVLSLRAFLKDKTPGAVPAYKFSKPGHGPMIPLIEQMLMQPYEIWLVPQRDENGRIRITRRYIGLWKSEDKQRIGGLAVFESAGGVWQGVTQFVPLGKKGSPDLQYVERQRRGVLIWRHGR